MNSLRSKRLPRSINREDPSAVSAFPAPRNRPRGKCASPYFRKFSTHSSKVRKPFGSIVINWIPIPDPGRAYATFPTTDTAAPPRTIRSLTFVSARKVSADSAKQPKRLRSLVRAVNCFSDSTSVSSRVAKNG